MFDESLPTISQSVGDRVRIFRRDGIWHANFQADHRQHRVSLRTRSEKEARRRALRIEGQLCDGRWKPAGKATTLNDVIISYRDFLKSERRAAKTLVKYDGVFARLQVLAHERGAKNIADLNLQLVDAYRAMRVQENAAPKTVYCETVILRQVVNFAVRRDLVPSDPLRGLRLKKPRATPQPCWTAEQVHKILANSPKDVQPAFLLLGETGMRYGELAWLTWDDIDFPLNLLHIRPKNGWAPKSGDQRSVPLSSAARNALGMLPRQWRWVVTMPPSQRHPQPGRQWSERRLLAALQQVLTKLHLPGKLHTFRHFFISHALMNGVPEATLRQWVGHVDAAIIRLYTHIHDSASQAAMRQLDAAGQEPVHQQGPPKRKRKPAQNQHKGKET